MFYVLSDFFAYMDGIYQAASTCASSSSVSQGLLIIGFGRDNGIDYWIVQNSWGASWGQNGFAKIKKGLNTCGIAACATFPTNLIDPENDYERDFSRHLHDVEKTGSMCLDGTPGAVYFSKGFGDGMNKTIIHFAGGGWC
jgi:hypothetical protein